MLLSEDATPAQTDAPQIVESSDKHEILIVETNQESDALQDLSCDSTRQRLPSSASERSSSAVQRARSRSSSSSSQRGARRKRVESPDVDWAGVTEPFTIATAEKTLTPLQTISDCQTGTAEAPAPTSECVDNKPALEVHHKTVPKPPLPPRPPLPAKQGPSAGPVHRSRSRQRTPHSPDSGVVATSPRMLNGATTNEAHMVIPEDMQTTEVAGPSLQAVEERVGVTLGELQGMWRSVQRDVVTIAGFDICVWRPLREHSAAPVLEKRRTRLDGRPAELWKIVVHEDGGIMRIRLQPQDPGPPRLAHIVQVERDPAKHLHSGAPSLSVFWSSGEKYSRCSTRVTLLPHGCTLQMAVVPEASVMQKTVKSTAREMHTSTGASDTWQRGRPPPPPPAPITSLEADPFDSKHKPLAIMDGRPYRATPDRKYRRRNAATARSESSGSSSSSSMAGPPMAEVRHLPKVLDEQSLYEIFEPACADLPEYSSREGPPIPRLRISRGIHDSTATFVFQTRALAVTFVRVFDNMRIDGEPIHVVLHDPNNKSCRGRNTHDE